ncbi:dupd1 [Symbiodinium sp. CCMP2592]|nr:dupd1 [Symbiodinium sp. CCMP2592]
MEALHVGRWTARRHFWGRLFRCLLALCLVRPTHQALNIDQVLEDAVLRLRNRVYIADTLVHKASAARCDSAVDGPHCRGPRGGLAADSVDAASDRSALVTDGIFSARLLGTADGGEMLDEYFLGASLKAASKNRHSEAASTESQRPKQASAGKPGGRSALLTFRGLRPWQAGLPQDFAGTRRLGGGVPFQVKWEGPWSLVENDEFENDAVKRHRFVARLVAGVGRIRFGRPVGLQSVDLRRPRSCRVPFGMPLVVKGRLKGVEVFQEVVPSWDLHTFVNGVAFFALTSTDVVDELVFQECILVGAIQLTFGFDLDAVFNDQLPDSQSEMPLYVTLREGWHAYGWDEIEFRIPADVETAPVWHLNDVASHRLSLRPGVFEHPQASSRDAPLPGLMDPQNSAELDAEEEALLSELELQAEAGAGDVSTPRASEGPEPIRMPADLEEVLDTAILPQEFVELAIARPRASEGVCDRFSVTSGCVCSYNYK